MNIKSKILAQFTDDLNKYGEDSVEVKDYYKYYDVELKTLFNLVIKTKKSLLNNEMKTEEELEIEHKERMIRWRYHLCWFMIGSVSTMIFLKFVVGCK